MKRSGIVTAQRQRTTMCIVHGLVGTLLRRGLLSWVSVWGSNRGPKPATHYARTVVRKRGYLARRAGKWEANRADFPAALELRMDCVVNLESQQAKPARSS